MSGKIYTPEQLEDEIIEARSLISPNKSFFFYDEMFYNAGPTANYELEGTFAVSTAVGGVIAETSGVIAGNRARVNHTTSQRDINPAKDTNCIMKFRTDNTVQVRHFIGFFDALPTNANPPVEPANGIYFRRTDAAAGGNWFAVTRNTNVETAVDTGIAADAVDHEFKIIIRGSIIKFFIDGVLKATITTNIPTANLFHGFVWVTTEAVAKTDRIDSLLIWSKR